MTNDDISRGFEDRLLGTIRPTHFQPDRGMISHEGFEGAEANLPSKTFASFVFFARKRPVACKAAPQLTADGNHASVSESREEQCAAGGKAPAGITRDRHRCTTRGEQAQAETRGVQQDRGKNKSPAVLESSG